jgi:hypothetical protein
MAKISLADLDKQQTAPGGIYVMNNTPAKGRSQIIFTVHKPNGNGQDNAFVPAIDLPVDLTMFIPKRQLLASSEFRRAVSLGLISLIDEQEYLRRMSEPGAEERVRNAMMLFNGNIGAMETTENEQASLADAEEKERDSIHPVVELVMTQVNSEDKEERISEMSALDQLRNLGRLTRKNYEYILTHSQKLPKIRAWVEKERAEIQQA